MQIDHSSSFSSLFTSSKRDKSSQIHKNENSSKQNEKKVQKKYSQYPIILSFKDNDLEVDFSHYFYGRTFSIRYFICYSIGAIISCLLLVLELDNPKLRELWLITGIITVALLAISAILSLVPCVTGRKYIFESIIVINQVLNSIRYGTKDTIMRGLKTDPFKIDLFYFDLSYVALLRPKLLTYIIYSVISSFCFMVYTPLISIGEGYSTWLFLFVIISYFLNQLFGAFYLYTTNRVSRMTFIGIKKLQLCNKKMEEELTKTNILLENILPSQFIPGIIEEKEKRFVIVKRIVRGCLLQTDVVHFTQFCSEKKPEDVISMLNKHFCSFDMLCKSFKMEKVKNVGDSLMCFGKCSNKETLKNIIMVGIGGIIFLKKMNKKYSWNVCLRVGVSIENFEACVFGSKRKYLTFEIFGAQFSLLSKLESTAKPNSVKFLNVISNYVNDIFKCTPTDCFDNNVNCSMIYIPENFKLDQIILHENDRNGLNGVIANAEKQILSISEDSNNHDIEKKSNLEFFKLMKGQDDKSKMLLKKIQEGRKFNKLKNLIECNSKNKIPMKKKHGLIFPFLLFKSLVREVDCFTKYFKLSRTNFLFINIAILITNLRLVFYFLIASKPWYIYESSIGIVNICFFVASLIFFCCILLFKKLYKFVIVSIISTMLILFILVLNLLINYSHSDDVISYHTRLYISAMAILMSLWIPTFHFYFRLLISVGFFSVEIFYLFQLFIVQEHFNEIYFAIMFTQSFILLCCTSVCAFFAEYYFKISYCQSLHLKENEKKILEEKKTHDGLILSVLPESIMNKMFSQNISNFSSKCRAFICYIKISPDLSSLLEMNNDNELMRKTVIRFVVDVFGCLDDEILIFSCSKIKSIKECYIFIADTVIQVLNVYEKSLNRIESVKSKYSMFIKGIEKIFLKFGLFYGEFFSGVIGKSRIAYDIFGDSVNISARLCASAKREKKGIHVLAGNIEPFFCVGSRLKLSERGEIKLKGKGNYKTSYLTRKDEKEIYITEVKSDHDLPQKLQE